MNIEKKSIRSSLLKTEKTAQITMNQDLNVPDIKPDAEKIVEARGRIHLSETEVMKDKIRIRGIFYVEILYISAAKKINRMDHEYPLEEIINIEGTLPDDTARIETSLEDLSVQIINSRKCGFRSVILLRAAVYEMKLVSCSTGLTGKDHVECLYADLPVTEIMIQKKDVQRIHAQVELPAAKPNIREILWVSLGFKDADTKMLDGKIAIRGALSLFILFEGEEEQEIPQYYHWEIPFSNELECSDSREDLIGDISVSLGSHQASVKADADGENRSVEVEAALELAMEAYQEYSLRYLKDMYANNRKIRLSLKASPMENLIFQNKARNKISYRIKEEEMKNLMQVLNVEGEVRIEDYHRQDNGLLTEGLIFARVLYIAGEDTAPLQSREFIIPFEFLAETQNIREMYRCELKSVLEQISCCVIDGNEIEIRATAGIYITGYSRKEPEMIDAIEEIPYTEEELARIPSITGYIVKKGDTVWKVAKRFGTTIDKMKEYNEEMGEELEVGQKLFLVKKMEFLY